MGGGGEERSGVSDATRYFTVLGEKYHNVEAGQNSVYRHQNNFKHILSSRNEKTKGIRSDPSCYHCAVGRSRKNEAQWTARPNRHNSNKGYIS